MSKNHLEHLGAKSSKTPSLKPALAAALASLEVQLDQELARYRRMRLAAHKTLNQSRWRGSTSYQPQKIAKASPQTITEGSQEFSLPQVPTTESPASNVVPDTREEALNHVKENFPKQHALKISSCPPEDTTPSSAKLVPAVIEERNKTEDLVTANTVSQPPDDYLESSEALLRSLTLEQSQQTKRSNAADSLLSPLGIGSMALLLMSSLMLGYVVFNPKNLPQFSFQKFLRYNSHSKTQTANNTNKTQSQPLLTPIPKYPNLAASEFPEVKNPNDVVGLTPATKPNSLPTPAVVPTTPNSTLTPQPQLTSTPSPVLPTLQSPAVSPTTAAPLQLSPSPTATPTSSTSPTVTLENIDDPQIKPSADGFYHIIADNQGETFAKARQVVPDAYLSPEKKFIYLGALKTKQQVKRQLQLLEEKGIKARVQQP
jgi:hypothetical protein